MLTHFYEIIETMAVWDFGKVVVYLQYMLCGNDYCYELNIESHSVKWLQLIMTLVCFSNHKTDVYVFTARRYVKSGICRRRVSVCLSVCLPHSGIVSKLLNRWITQIMPHDSPEILVLWRQKSRRNSNGITPYGGDKCRWGGLNWPISTKNAL